MEITRVIAEAEVDLTNATEALRVLERFASRDGSAARSAMDDRDCRQGDLVTTWTGLQVAETSHLTTFARPK